MPVWLSNVLALCIGCFIALLLCEFGSRFVLPLGTGVVRRAADGERLRGWLQAGRTYRQISSEFDARTTITAAGYRAPAALGNPDVVFVGDSFTFGWGIDDDETFAALSCATLHLRCANLGAPGTGTVDQVARLARYLKDQSWRPAEVKLFVFAMSATFSAGNDLFDNYLSARRDGATGEGTAPDASRAKPVVAPGLMERLLGQRRFVLRHSNLVRLAKYYWGPALRATLVPELDRIRLDESLRITHGALAELDRLSAEYGFHLSIYLIHPVQDIIRRTAGDTLRLLEAIAPVPVRPTAQLFASDPKRYYYAFDGHINPAGSHRIAELLIGSAQPI